jgi:hypothetical protein
MSKTDQFWQHAARYLVSSSPDQIHTPINDQAAPTQVLTPEEGTRGLNPRNIVRKQVNMANWPIFEWFGTKACFSRAGTEICRARA